MCSMFILMSLSKRDPTRCWNGEEEDECLIERERVSEEERERQREAIGN